MIPVLNFDASFQTYDEHEKIMTLVFLEILYVLGKAYKAQPNNGDLRYISTIHR